MDILSNPQLYYALSQTVNKNNYYPKHVHGYYEILIILKEKLLWKLNYAHLPMNTAII